MPKVSGEVKLYRFLMEKVKKSKKRSKKNIKKTRHSHRRVSNKTR